MTPQTICARCERVIAPGDGTTTMESHGLCLQCVPAVSDVPIERLTDMPPEQLDELPYGIVRLDVDGTVIAYNDAEAEISHLARERVLGRNFFRDVAPCTNVQELAGWLTDATREGEAAHKVVRFLFDFAHGRQFVRIALSYDAPKQVAHMVVDLIGEEERP